MCPSFSGSWGSEAGRVLKAESESPSGIDEKGLSGQREENCKDLGEQVFVVYLRNDET